jgi:hypothetical protein
MSNFIYIPDSGHPNPEFEAFHKRRRNIELITMLLAFLYLINLGVSSALLMLVESFKDSLNAHIYILVWNIVISIAIVFAFNKFKF